MRTNDVACSHACANPQDLEGRFGTRASTVLIFQSRGAERMVSVFDRRYTREGEVEQGSETKESFAVVA